jgi:hypothetical protein
MALLLLAIGLIVRAERFGLRFPIWGDEAFVTVNFLERDYIGLTKQLECGQVAPVLFLWTELTVKKLLGSSEWALRLVPFLFGCGSLWLMWLLARQVVSRLAAMLSLGILAVASWPIGMSCFVKSYSADLFFALAVTAIAVSWLRQPAKLSRLALLALIIPIAVGSSYPIVFVGGAVSLALLPTVWRQPGMGAKIWFVAYNLLMIGSFYAHFALVGREQLDSTASDIHSYLLEYWADGFPPDSARKWPLWLLDIQAGQMMAYPYGDSHGGSAATLIFAIIGSVIFWRTGRRALLVMMLAPFALNLLAAILHKYPYGGSCRLSQHLAPACCLLMGTGIAYTIERWSKSLSDRLYYAKIWCAIFIALGSAAFVFQAYRPYRDDDALWTRKVVRDLSAKIQKGDEVMVTSGKRYGGAMLWWNLGIQKYPVAWDGAINWERLEQSGGRLWICDMRAGPTTAPRPLQEIEARLKPAWRVVGMVSWYIIPTDAGIDEAMRCDLYLCGRKDQHIEMPFFAQWPQQ